MALSKRPGTEAKPAVLCLRSRGSLSTNAMVSMMLGRVINHHGNGRGNPKNDHPKIKKGWAETASQVVQKLHRNLLECRNCITNSLGMQKLHQLFRFWNAETAHLLLSTNAFRLLKDHSNMQYETKTCKHKQCHLDETTGQWKQLRFAAAPFLKWRVNGFCTAACETKHNEKHQPA